jgi:RNA polymerase-binding transcription factor DksA
MTRLALKTYRRRLSTLAAQLGGEVADLRGDALQYAVEDSGAEPVQIPVPKGDQAGHCVEEEMTLALLGNEEVLLSEVDDALKRMRHGKFGRCGHCGKRISRERLRAMPYARYCVPCAARREAAAVRD